MRWLVPFLSVGAVILLRLAVTPIIGTASPFLLFVLAVAASAWHGGLSSGLVATAVAGIAGTLFLSPGGGFLPHGAVEYVQLSLFVVVGVVVSGFAESLMRAEVKTRAAELAAAREREQLRVVLQSVGDGVIATDEEGCIRLCNVGAARLTGFSADDAIGKPLRDVFRILNEDTRAQASDPVVTVLRDGVATGVADRTLLVARDGSERPITVSAAPMRDDAGAARGAVLVFIDDSQRRAADRERERLLREVELERSRLQDVFQQAPSFMCLLSGPDHVYERENLRHAQLIGHRDILGRPVREALPEVQAQGIIDILDDVYRTGKAFVASGMAVMLPHTPGEGLEERVLDFVYQPLKDADAKVTAILVQGVDVTEHVRAQHALDASELRYRTLFESIDEGFCIIEMIFDDANRPVDYRFVEMNPAFEHQSGLRGATGKTMRELAPEMDQTWFDRYGEVAVTGKPQRFVAEAAALGRWFDVYALRVGTSDSRRVAVLFNDITAAKRAEDDVRKLNAELEGRVAERTAALEAVNRELEAFSYSVSHDLRAPLRGIDGFAKILHQKYVETLDDKGRHYLERIRAGTQRMGNLIDDLLRLSRLTRAQIRIEPVELAATARDVIEELRRSDPGREVVVRIPDSLPARGDAQLLRVVLVNLLGNAWKFTSKTPNATVEVGETVVGGRRAFFVRDNGAGFDMAYIDKLFSAFQRLHAQSDFEGTGIGLATVQRIITRHGGTVWAEATQGAGATFWFTLGIE